MGTPDLPVYRGRMADLQTSEARFAAYAHPERLVSTDWLAAQLDGGNPEGVVVLESDEDVLLYDTGHIPGAVKLDWHTRPQRPS